MGFSAARPTNQDQIGAAFDPAVAGADCHDVRLGDHRYDIEVKTVEGFAWQQSGVCQMPLDTPSVAFGDLVFGERGKEASRRPTLLIGLLSDGRPMLLDRGKPQVIENELEAGGVDGRTHAATARALLSSAS